MSDAADLVGYIVGEDEGAYIYACADHAPAEAMREPHREVLRDEAEEVAAICENCGLELWEAKLW